MQTVTHARMTAALTDALSVILPTPEQTWFLRACLYTGPSGRQSWEAWQASAGGASGLLADRIRSYKGLLPLLFIVLRRHGVVVDRTMRTYMRTAYVREQLRSQTYRRICRTVLTAFTEHDLPVMILKGAVLADTVYAEPALRHCHDIDMLVRRNDLFRATSLLVPLGCKLLKEGQRAEEDNIKLEHASGLPLELHGRLFRLSHYRTSWHDVWARSQSQIIAGVPARVLSPADTLLHVCGHAASCRSRESLRWVCDSWLLMQRYPQLDWDVFVDHALRSRLVLPLWVMLNYLANDLQAPVPDVVLNRLYTAMASQTNARDHAAALLGARAGSRGQVRNLTQATTGWRARTRVVRWLLVPAPSYIRWADQVHTSWLLPIYYVYRPWRFVARRLWHYGKGVMRRMRLRKCKPTSESVLHRIGSQLS